MCPKIRQSIGVKDFNELISCHLCKGYLIDATTIIECLHSFCKTCIINHLESNTPKSRFCPFCDNQIHKTKPKLNIRSDPTLQDIVYKLVPGLYKNEMNRRKEFYSKEPESAVGLSNEEKGEIAGERLIFTPEDKIYLSIEYFPQVISYPLLPFSHKTQNNGAFNSIESNTVNGINGTDSQRRYLRCEGGMRVIHLKKWLKQKYDIKDHNDIEILYKHDPLLDDYTMIDLAYIYSWRRNGPLCLYYKITEPQKPSLVAQKEENSKVFKVPGVVSTVKRRNTVKHRHKQNGKKRKLIDESNLITTNPVNEPLPPVDSALIDKVANNLDFMTNVVNNTLTNTATNSLKKSINNNNKSKHKIKSQLNNINKTPAIPVPKTTANNNKIKKPVDLIVNQTTGAMSTTTKSKVNDCTEINGLNKNSMINTINTIKKTINDLNTIKPINSAIFGPKIPGPDDSLDKLIQSFNGKQQKFDSNPSQTSKQNTSINQNNAKPVDNNKNKTTVTAVNTDTNGLKPYVNADQKQSKPNNSINNTNNDKSNSTTVISAVTPNTSKPKSSSQSITGTNSMGAVAPTKHSNGTNNCPKGVLNPDINGRKQSKSKTKSNSYSNLTTIVNNYNKRNTDVTITPVPKPTNTNNVNNVNKNPTINLTQIKPTLTGVDPNRTPEKPNSNGLNLSEKPLKLTKPSNQMSKSQVKSNSLFPSFISSPGLPSPLSAPDIFQFSPPFALSSSKQMPNNTSNNTAFNTDINSDNNDCNDSEVALNLSTSKDKTT